MDSSWLAQPSSSPRAAGDVSAWCTSRHKRCFDLALSLPALLLLGPVMLAVAALVRLTSKGPALFTQERIGLHHQPFTIFKFRTMTVRAASEGPNVTRQGDPRMTPVGAVLRRLKLDELPQLINVLRGEMSLVGPRPKLAEHEQMFLVCRPGVTGAATLAFAHEEAILAEVPESELEAYAVSVLSPIKHRLDASYAAEATFRSDLALLARTVWKLNGPAAGPWQIATLDQDAPPVGLFV
jgi:lipopolysaccharide/colanic/teichoic acid biosynthesis glycosyltransferase